MVSVPAEELVALALAIIFLRGVLHKVIRPMRLAVAQDKDDNICVPEDSPLGRDS